MAAPTVSPLVRTLVRWMDDAIAIPGTRIRIGWDAILGLVAPGVGDAATALSQVALLVSAVRARAPWSMLARMLLNVAMDALFGSIPLLGDLFDATFKANRKNLALLDQLDGGPDASLGLRPRDYALLAFAITCVLAIIATPFVLAAWLLARWL